MQELVDFALDLAEISAAIIKPYFRTQVAVENKGDGSPVTIADRKAEEAMRERIMRAFPDHGIIGEEFGRHQPDAPYQWTLDPIDGTKNFIAGSFLFGTLIALLHEGIPVLGLLNQPAAGEMVIGYEGAAWSNGQKTHVRPCATIEAALMLSSTHWSVAKYHALEPYEALTRRPSLYRTWGDCHGYFLLATGYADIMMDPIMQIWDVAPLVPIVEGAGGVITDWYGGPALSGRGVVATAGPIHDAVIQALRPESPA